MATQFLKKLLSSYYVLIFNFSPWAPMGSQISLSRVHEKSVSKLLSEVLVISRGDELTDQKEVSQKDSFSFLQEDISLPSIFFYEIRNISS